MLAAQRRDLGGAGPRAVQPLRAAIHLGVLTNSYGRMYVPWGTFSGGGHLMTPPPAADEGGQHHNLYLSLWVLHYERYGLCT